MNFEKYWNPDDTTTTNISSEDLRKLKPSSSVHPLNKLQQIMRQQAYFGAGLLMIFLLLIFVFSHSLLTSLLIAFCAYAIYFLFRSFRILKRISLILNQPNENILKKLKSQHAVIKDYVKFSEIIAALLYPLSIVAGMIITFLIMGEESPESLFLDPFLLIISMAAIVLFVPIQYFLTHKMNQKAFGPHLDSLKEMTEKLEQE
ncbi:hypothetical protein QYS49_07460 [Marivirga salinae]|uniref:Uncharacterized protein n=1 Tax=Marivirga salinarum TaxID=3059078 RepID=A0AA49GCF2_9BACT|nr:hypothetical protein [Marivirga sp. BDSF4-3]WKK77056.2 hypothetical protein QYS49_07460 [Marivirga sp. BDSF4-3]